MLMYVWKRRALIDEERSVRPTSDDLYGQGQGGKCVRTSSAFSGLVLVLAIALY